MTYFLVLLSFLLPVPPGIRKQLDDIHREYLSGPDVASLVALDAKIRKLIEEPWKRDRKSIDVQKTNPSWAAIGVEMAHFSESLVYSGKLLVEAHRKNPSSGLRKFTLFAEVMGERPSHGMGEMPNLNAMNFALYNALGGGATRTLNIDQTGKTMGTALLRMQIEIPE